MKSRAKMNIGEHNISQCLLLLKHGKALKSKNNAELHFAKDAEHTILKYAFRCMSRF